MRKRVVIAMSGGVDSSVAAYLLQQQGYEPIGLFMRNGVDAPAMVGNSKTCCSIYDAKDARMVAADLGIPFHAMDLSTEFAGLINYFTKEYQSGRTPNPCAMCNRDLKFGRLFEFARELGAQYLATGHYAVIDRQNQQLRLRRGVDRGKDQSYQLFSIQAEYLPHILFPLGEMHKNEVRDIAKKIGMQVSGKPESQEICFVPTNDYRDLLREKGVQSTAGNIVDVQGNKVAEHDGIAQFTVGQRRGLGAALGVPHYVIDIQAATGTVVIGTRAQSMFRGGIASKINWLGPLPQMGAQIPVQIQIRYRHPGRAGVMRFLAEQRVEFRFTQPEPAITPGQAAVFYQDDCVLGGGWIETAIP